MKFEPGKITGMSKKEYDESIAEQRTVLHGPKSMTDRAKLAEKLFTEGYEIGMTDIWYKTRAKGAIFAADTFFDTLEGSNNEDE